jgi:hypothetical protein
MTVYRPENIINRYVWEQFKTQAPAFYSLYPQTAGGNDLIPFFPAGVGNIPPEILDGDLPYIVFDKFTKVRTGAYKYFYPVKSEQMRYTIYGGSLYGEAANGGDRYGNTVNLTSLITLVLDREDAAADDINEFAEELYDNYPVSASASVYDYYKYRFQCINVFQSGYAESQQDVSNLMEYRPSRDLIIKYDYHSRQYNES